MTIQVSDLSSFCVTALKAAGLHERDARTTAEALVLTDTWGVHTHGTKNLRGYIRRIREGGIHGKAQPHVDSEGLAWAIIDGDGAIGMVASGFAMNVAIEKARQTGIAYVGLHNSCHFGAAGVYANLAAARGMIGIAMSNDTPTVAVPGSRQAVLGSNPISYAIPVEGSNAILLDIATSTVAGGKVFAAAAHQQKIPEGWLIDDLGAPTSNPALFPDHATLTPMSGHKGYGIALLIETLSAILTGAAVMKNVLSWSFGDPKVPTNHGAAFIAIDIGAIMVSPLFQGRLQEAIDQLRNAPRAPGCDRIYLPGEKEWEHRKESLTHGLELPPEIIASLHDLAKELSLKWTLN
jgi:ureidoglycolate dehydrogenase (NAD+)